MVCGDTSRSCVSLWHRLVTESYVLRSSIFHDLWMYSWYLFCKKPCKLTIVTEEELFHCGQPIYSRKCLFSLHGLVHSEHLFSLHRRVHGWTRILQSSHFWKTMLTPCVVVCYRGTLKPKRSTPRYNTHRPTFSLRTPHPKVLMGVSVVKYLFLKTLARVLSYSQCRIDESKS